MNEHREALKKESSQPSRPAIDAANDSSGTGIGAGKKVGLYGMGLLLLGLIVVVVVTYLAGYFVPLEGAEGVGP